MTLVQRDVAFARGARRLNAESAIGSARRDPRRSLRTRKHPPAPSRRRDRPWHGPGARARARRSGSPSHNTMSAAAREAWARAMPIDSTSSSISRRPAESTSRKGTPPIAVGASTRSRVVPATAEVIAASRPAKALSKLDLPALGGPAMTTFMPSLSRSARGRARAAASSSWIARTCAPKSGGRWATSPSSEKSSAASTSADKVRMRACQAATCRLSAPPARASAARRCDSVSASSKSASPSASAKSMRPFSKARRVNSPGCAGLSPAIRSNAASALATTARPP